MGCTTEASRTPLSGQDVHLTILHTSDWHSRLFPYTFTVGRVDEQLGLLQQNAPFGGAARIAHLLQRERANTSRVVHLDGGDCFQGAPVFNFFRGEAEMRTMSAVGTDAMVIANHEFDLGAENFTRQAQRWSSFPILAANYLFDPPDVPGAPQVGSVAQPYTILNADGLRIGVIGIANLSSLNTIFESPNRLGVAPQNTVDTAQFYIDWLRPQVDLVVLVSHIGLTDDEEMIERTEGADIVLGGHLHIVLNPPRVVRDCARVDSEGRNYVEVRTGFDNPSVERRYCRPRQVVLAHSGAFMKYLGRLDIVASDDPIRIGEGYDDLNGFEVLSHRYQLLPVDSTVPEDRQVAEMLEPYANQLVRLTDLDLLVGYAPNVVRRFGSVGGDSPLGNLIADAMWLRLGIQTDFALTNSLGIRADLVQGPVPVEELFNVFPFENTITTMFLSGREVREVYDFIARRSSGRGCSTQAQTAGARVVLNCGRCRRDRDRDGTPDVAGPCAEIIAIGQTQQECDTDTDCVNAPDDPNDDGLCDPIARRCLLPIVDDASYELAASDYIARGGSGFLVLQRNTTQRNTFIPQRDALSDFIRNGPPCGADPATGQLPACTADADCFEGFACQCPTRQRYDDTLEMCTDAGNCPAEGRCVLASCRDQVRDFAVRRECSNAADALAAARCECDALVNAGEACKLLACIDDTLGVRSDGRIRMVPP